jgi:signal transduction histidine kinase
MHLRWSSAGSNKQHERSDEGNTWRRDHWLLLARVALLAISILALVVYVVGTPANLAWFNSFHTDCLDVCMKRATLQSLHELGIPLTTFAIYLTSVNLLFALTYFMVAAFIFWRKSDDRMALLASFSRLGERLEATLIPDAILPTIVETVAQALKLPYAAIELLEGEQYRLAAIYGESMSPSLSIPLLYQQETIGQLLLAARSPGESFSAAARRLLDDLARQAGIAAHTVRLSADLQRSRERLLLAQEEERRRLARELHDSVSQALYGISLGAHTARTALDRDPSQLAEPLDYVLTLAEAALAEMRALIFELRPESLETEGLVLALTKQAAAIQARHNIVVSTDLSSEPELPVRVKQELYRIAQEALHNTVKHAHANKIDLRLEQTSEGVILEVRDDGVGFDTTASFPGHLGLHSMRERVENLSGTYEIESAPGTGTRIAVRIPVKS